MFNLCWFRTITAVIRLYINERPCIESRELQDSYLAAVAVRKKASLPVDQMRVLQGKSKQPAGVQYNKFQRS